MNKIEEKEEKEEEVENIIISREELVILAKAAEEAERFDDMLQFANKLCKRSTSDQEELNVEERNLLSVAFKNVTSNLRTGMFALEDQVDKLKRSKHSNNQISVTKKKHIIFI